MSGNKRVWEENLGGSGLNVSRYSDGTVYISDNFESVRISEEYLGVIGSYLVRLYEGE